MLKIIKIILLFLLSELRNNRWITLGKDRAGELLVAIHTFLEKSEDVCIIRMISARKATRKEIKQYEGDKP